MYIDWKYINIYIYTFEKIVNCQFSTIYVCMYVCMYVCVYIYIYIYIYIYQNDKEIRSSYQVLIVSCKCVLQSPVCT